MHVYVVCRVFSWVYSLCGGASIIQRLRKSEEELTATHCIHPMLHNYLSLSPENTLKTMTWEKLEQCLFKVGTGFRWWTMHTIWLFVRLQRKLEVILYACLYVCMMVQHTYLHTTWQHLPSQDFPISFSLMENCILCLFFLMTTLFDGAEWVPPHYLFVNIKIDRYLFVYWGVSRIIPILSYLSEKHFQKYKTYFLMQNDIR